MSCLHSSYATNQNHAIDYKIIVFPGLSKLQVDDNYYD